MDRNADPNMLAILTARLGDAESSLKTRAAEIRGAQTFVADAKDRVEFLAQEKTSLQSQIRAAHSDGGLLQTQIERALRRIGKLEAERDLASKEAASAASDVNIAALSLKRRVLETLVSHLRTLHSLANEETKFRFSERILAYVHHCGLASVEAIRLDAQLRPLLVQNGNEVGFSDLSPGEKSRFVLAFFFALAIAPAADLPTAAHPGLLLIDSPGKEEMVEKDFKAVVELLRFIESNHAKQVQAIVATAYRDIRGATSVDKTHFIENDDDPLFS